MQQPSSKPSSNRLITGTKLGPYEILAVVGAGGMGEVYRARDTRLGRTVAIKVLPAHLSSNPELKQRLEREARAVSSLSHPHICSLFDIGQQDGVDYLVMEFLEGQTLADRLERGPLPVEQALRFAIEIADAMEKAHKQGVIHRDLKPGNIMLTKAGAKLMDFGLAKAAAPLVTTSPLEAATAAERLTAMATRTKPLTAEGTIVGTFEYMAPEQLEGKEADARSDIFALGAVLYEMITGKRAFSGKTTASVIAAVLASEPQPVTQLQPLTPPTLERLVRTCLAKDPEDRWQSTHDIKLELKAITENPTQGVLPSVSSRATTRQRKFLWVLAAALALLVLIFALGYFYAARVPPQVTKLAVPAPDGGRFSFSGDAAGPVVISADGSALAFVAANEKGTPLLYVRRLDELKVRALPGTEYATFPFWSPDGKSLGFFAQGKLKRVALAGGSPLDICDASDARGGTWGADGVIVFSPNIRTGLFRVPASGGTPAPFTKVDEPRHTTHRWPYFLPNGKHLLYLAANHLDPSGPGTEIYWTSIDGGESRLVTQSSANATYSSNHILYSRGRVLLAQQFAPSSGKLRGEPLQVADQIHVETGTWRGVYDASQTGLLVYQVASAVAGSELVMYDRSGKKIRTIGDPDKYFDLKLSPDGKKLAMTVGDPIGNIWVFDFARNVRTKLTFANNNDSRPLWSRDGKQITFSRFFPFQAYEIAANGEGREKLLYTDPSPVFSRIANGATDRSPDGRYLLLTQGPLGTTAINVHSVAENKTWPLLEKSVDEFDASFSPDGRWVAFTSRLSGSQEIYVVSFPEARGTWQISTNTGSFAKWSHTGKEIIYLALDGTFMSTPVRANGQNFEVGTPRPLFRVSAKTTIFPWDTVDEQRFVVNTVGEEDTASLTVVTNWTAELKK